MSQKDHKQFLELEEEPAKKVGKEKTIYKPRKLNGRYDFDNMDLICKCRHRLGIHAPENESGTRPCWSGQEPEENGKYGKLCNCKDFKPKQK